MSSHFYYLSQKKKGGEMIMRYAKVIAVVLMVMFLGAIYKVAISGDVPATITIKDEAFGKLKKAPVEFTHEKHFKEHKIACTECHHLYKEGKNVWKEGDPVKKCSECHKPAAAEKDALSFCKKTYPKGKAPGLKCAYHMNCVGCHKAEKKAGKKPPTSCSKCHPRKH